VAREATARQRTPDDFYVDLFMQEHRLDQQSKCFQARVRRVLRELSEKAQAFLLEDPRLEIRVLTETDWGPDVWAFFPFYRGRYNIRRWAAGFLPPSKPKAHPDTTVMLVFNAEKFEKGPAKLSRDRLRHHLGHTLLFLLFPEAPNECADADEEWQIWSMGVDMQARVDKAALASAAVGTAPAKKKAK
jgi:hypothetical protein